MTEMNRKTTWLAVLCFSLFLTRLGFRAVSYDHIDHNTNDPYGLSDLIELALALIYQVGMALSILHAFRVLLRHWDQGALGASLLLALCAMQWHSYDYLHRLAASRIIQ